MKKKLISLVTAACMLAAVLTGCGAAKGNELPKKLVFTYVTAPLNVPTIVEKEKGILSVLPG